MNLLHRQKLAIEAAKYSAAMTELGRIAQRPLRSAAERQAVHTAIEGIRGHLKYVRSKRLQIVLGNSTLRKTLESEIRTMTRYNYDQFIRQLRQNPKTVLRFPVAREALNAIGNEAAASGSVIYSAMLVMVKESQEAKKDLRGMAKTAASAFMAEKMAAAEKKMRELEAAKAAAEQKFLVAVIEGAIQIAWEVFAVSSGGPLPPPPSQERAAGTAQVDWCLDAAAQRRDSCKAKCPPGAMGDSCRGICDAVYLSDVVNCLL